MALVVEYGKVTINAPGLGLLSSHSPGVTIVSRTLSERIYNAGSKGSPMSNDWYVVDVRWEES